MSNKLCTMLWFDGQAEEAARFYTSVFKNSKLGGTSRYGENMPAPAGTVMTVAFEIEGHSYVALNAGPMFKFNESISFVVNCDTQDEIDYYWDKLTSDGGQEVQCGWLKDKYGLAWQITPRFMLDVHASGDAAKINRMMQALMQMPPKLDLAKLKRAAEGEIT